MADLEPQDKQKLVTDFCQMCMASEELATQYLDAHKWDLMAACNSYFADEDDKPESTAASAVRDESYTGPRTLDGRPAPEDQRRQPQKAAAKPQQSRIATLGSLSSSSHNHGEDEDDKDDDFDDADDDDGRGNLFAGGEKSGLAVQDPRQEASSRSIIKDIVGEAKANASRLQAAATPRSPTPSHFRGTGMLLGGDGVESRSIPDPLGPPQPAASASVEERVLHIWQDGFSIDDGELQRFDDPANQVDLAMIRSGRAPLHLMNVLPEQSIDVKLCQHDTPYSPPPKKYKPFTGSGHRLGSPVPGFATASGTSSTPTSATTATTEKGSSSKAVPPTTELDSSQPVLTIRVQLPDGTRLPARFNPSNTIHNIYTFIRGASPETRDRPWTLATTFPNKEHADTDTALSEMPEFKKGGTAVVKWV